MSMRLLANSHTKDGKRNKRESEDIQVPDDINEQLKSNIKNRH